MIRIGIAGSKMRVRLSSFRNSFLVVLAAGFATAAAGQSAKSLANWANLNQLAQGSEIRVTLANGRTLRGFLQSTTPESLAVNATTSQETLVRQDIQRISVKKPGHRGRHTLIGLAIGTGAGLAIGAGLDRASNDNWFPNAGK